MDTLTDTLHITNSGSGSLSWSASLAPSVTWLSLSGSPGLAPSDLVLTLNPTGQPAGTLTDTVVITSADANNSPRKVPVTFRIRQPVLSVTPSSLSDNAQQGDTAKKTKTLNVTNTGGGTLSWTATPDTTWLSAVPGGGTGAGSITVTLNPAGLASGTHTGHVTVTSVGATGSPAQITVTFTITPPPQLSVTLSSKPDTAFLGSTASKTSAIRISNSGGGSLAWNALLPDTTWLTRSKVSGSAPPDDSTIVSSNPSGLAAVTHIGHMVIDAGAVAGSPVTVTKTLVIVPCTVHPVTPDSLDAGSLTTADCAAPHRAGSFARVYSVNASTGDTLDVQLSASFDAFIVVTDGAGTVVPTSDACPGLTACVRNVVVPSNGVRIEATTTVGGATGSFNMLVTKPQRPAGPILLSQRKGDGSTIIGVGATTDTNVVVLRADTLRDPNARDTLQLQVELRFAHVANFAGVATDASTPVLPGAAATITHTGLTDDTVYHWRARTCDQTSRCSVWADFVTGRDTAPDFKVAVPQAPIAPVTPLQTYPSGTQIAVGGPDTTDTIVLKATVSDSDPGDQLRLQVERRTAGSTFSNVPTATASSAVASGQVSSITLTGQADDSSYRWQARACDQTNRCGPWVDFGGNGTGADYKIAIPERPAAPAQLNQYLAGGTTPIAVGGAAGGNPGSTVNVVFKATVTDPDPGDLISIEVEVQTTDVAFDTTTNLHRGAGVVTTGRAAVTVGFSVPLVLSTNYHWHARACDQTNRCSGWVAFGGNVDLDPSSLLFPSDTDFHVP